MRAAEGQPAPKFRTTFREGHIDDNRFGSRRFANGSGAAGAQAMSYS